MGFNMVRLSVPTIPALKRLRQEFKATLGYIMTTKPGQSTYQSLATEINKCPGRCHLVVSTSLFHRWYMYHCSYTDVLIPPALSLQSEAEKILNYGNFQT